MRACRGGSRAPAIWHTTSALSATACRCRFEVGADPGLAQQTGLLYVIEGSRLGGRLLLRRVRPDFSAEFLSTVHEPGAWRAITRALDARAGLEGAAWLEEVVGGALHGFALYGAAAENLLASPL